MEISNYKIILLQNKYNYRKFKYVLNGMISRCAQNKTDTAECISRTEAESDKKRTYNELNWTQTETDT